MKITTEKIGDTYHARAGGFTLAGYPGSTRMVDLYAAFELLMGEPTGDVEPAPDRTFCENCPDASPSGCKAPGGGIGIGCPL